MQDNIPVIVIDMSPAAARRRHFDRLMREFARIPDWVMLQENIVPELDQHRRKACRQNHLFVNGQSKFCHICGEAR